MSINLSRNTRLWISTVTTGHNNANTFEIPVQEGYSLSQSVTSSDVMVEEAGPTPTRGSKRFNETMDPVDWSFTTYTTPYEDTNHYTCDMLLWHALANADGTATDFDNTTTTSTVFGDGTAFNVGFTNNSAHVLTKLYLYFKIDNQTYFVDAAQVSQAEVSIDIADIGQVAWSGQALSYAPIADPAFMAATGLSLDEASPSATSNFVKIPAVKSYLINKLTIMNMTADVAPSANNNYGIPITGANLTINNNITYLTPSTLAQVDKPVGSFTGSFEVSGSIEAYLKDTGGTGSAASKYGSAELLQHMLSNVAGAVTNAANIVLNVGGLTGARMEVTIPLAHLAVPDLSVDDVVSTSFEFKGIPSSSSLISGDEVSLKFYAS